MTNITFYKAIILIVFAIIISSCGANQPDQDMSEDDAMTDVATDIATTEDVDDDDAVVLDEDEDEMAVEESIEEEDGVIEPEDDDSEDVDVVDEEPADEQPEEEVCEYETYSLVLESYEHKTSVIILVKTLTGLGLREAKDLVDTAPSTILTGLTYDEAVQIASQLEEETAVVSVVGEGDCLE